MSASHSSQDVLAAIREGGREAVDRLVPLVYDELRAVAHRQLRHGEAGRQATLGTTGLVHEAYLKLVDQSRATYKDRAHFLAVAGVVMRYILVDRARARLAEKRGGERRPVTLDDDAIAIEDQPQAIIDIDAALHALEAVSPRLARVVESRFFGGLTDQETATALGITVRTVQRDWMKARMLLRRVFDD